MRAKVILNYWKFPITWFLIQTSHAKEKILADLNIYRQRHKMLKGMRDYTLLQNVLTIGEFKAFRNLLENRLKESEKSTMGKLYAKANYIACRGLWEPYESIEMIDSERIGGAVF